MKTATLHMNDLNLPGQSACFKLSEPVTFGGKPFEYVIIWITPPDTMSNAEVAVLTATEYGSCLGDMRRRAGFTALDDYDPANADYVNGCYFMALTMLGCTYVETPPAPTEEV